MLEDDKFIDELREKVQDVVGTEERLFLLRFLKIMEQ